MCRQGIGAAAGQLDSPWDHLPPLSGLPVSIMFTDQLLFLTALDKAPKPQSPLRGDKEMPQPLALPVALRFWCSKAPDPKFLSVLQHWCQDFSIPRALPPLVTSSGSKFTPFLPEASERVMEQVGWNVLGSEFHCRCWCNFRQLKNCKLGPLSLRLCFPFYDPLEENEFPGLSSSLQI